MQASGQGSRVRNPKCGVSVSMALAFHRHRGATLTTQQNAPLPKEAKAGLGTRMCGSHTMLRDATQSRAAAAGCRWLVFS
jgi:hypothetical protein